MKAKTRIKLILALAAVMATALIGGCSIGQADYEATLKQYDLTSQVTYYGNGGYFGSEILYNLVGFPEGSKFYNIQSSGSGTTISASSSQYLFNGWYYVDSVEIDGENYYVCEDDTVAENFTLTEDEEERVVVISHDGELVISQTDYDYILRTAKSYSELPILKLGEAVDTSMTLPEGHIYVAAGWISAQKVDYVLVLKDGATSLKYTNTDSSGNTVEYELYDGDVIYSSYFGTNDSVTVITRSPLIQASSANTLVDATWLETFYKDADCTEAYSSAAKITKPDDGDVTIYVPYIDGDWEIVKTASDVRSIFTSSAKNYYIMNDIDCSGWSYASSAITTFSGTINGNGHTISGISVTKTGLSNSSVTAVFGTLSGTATIKDITFDGLTVTYTTGAPLSGIEWYINTYFLFAGVASGATPTISGVTVSNATMDITVNSGVTVMNIQSETDVDNWLYAVSRSDGETDADFEQTYGGITLSGVKLIYNGNTIAEISAE